MSLQSPSRRELLLASGTLFAWAHLPKLAMAEGRDPRFLTIVLRGALDGFAAVAPIGDPNWAKLRGDKALALGGATPALPLDGFFALNPAMPNLHRMYQSGSASIVHASATPYRERSHFDGQDVLESGFGRAGFAATGWLNRALATLAPAQRANPKARNAFAVGPIAPLVVRGPAPVLSWTPPQLPSAGEDMKMRLLDLYRHTDPALARVLEERMNLTAIARTVSLDDQNARNSRPLFSTSAVVRAYFEQSAGTAANSWRARMARASARSPSTAGIPTPMTAPLTGGWRRCSARSTVPSPRSKPIWGRPGARPWSRSSPSSAAPPASTAPPAPTTAPAVALVGGALRGGRVIADWPGLRDADLYEGRDLKPTTDLRAVLKGLLRDHLRVDEAVLASKVFPDSAAVKPMAGLLA